MTMLYLPFNAFSQGNCPDSSIINCSQWEGPFKDTLEITGYPGCPIEIEYKQRICEDTAGNAVVEYYVISFKDPEPSDECNDLLNNMWIPYGNREDGEPNWNFVEWVFLQLGFSLAKEKFLEEYNTVPPNEKPYYECPNYRRKYIITWRSCTQVGVYRYKVKLGYLDFWIYLWVLKPCLDAVCCKQEFRICWDKENNQMNIEESWEPLVIECDPSPPEIPGAFISSGCLPWCGINY